MKEGRKSMLTMTASMLLAAEGSFVISDTEIQVRGMGFKYSEALNGWIGRHTNIDGITREMIQYLEEIGASITPDYGV